MSRPPIVSFYTDDDIYRPCAERLRKSCEAFGWPHYLYRYDREGLSWEGCTCRVPELIRGALEELEQPFVWLDADAEIVQHPILFDSLPYRNPPVTWAFARASLNFRCGTAYFTPGAIPDLRKWEAACRQLPLPGWRRGNQAALNQLYADNAFRHRPFALPLAYCAIVDLDAEIPKPKRVIIQHQASRKARMRWK